jgi:hypothetical protein
VQASPKKALHFSRFKSEHISLKYPLPNSPVLLLFLGTSAYHPQIANARWLVLTGIRSPVLAPYFELLPVSGLSMNQKQRGKEKVITDHVVVVLMTERTSPKLSH